MVFVCSEVSKLFSHLYLCISPHSDEFLQTSKCPWFAASHRHHFAYHCNHQPRVPQNIQQYPPATAYIKNTCLQVVICFGISNRKNKFMKAVDRPTKQVMVRYHDIHTQYSHQLAHTGEFPLFGCPHKRSVNYPSSSFS